MNKNELSAAIAAKAGLTRKDAEAALCAMSDIIAESLKNGEKVQIVGFGAFEVKERPARKARNPKTGEEIERPCNSEQPFSALVYKTIADPFVGKLSLFRIFSGMLTSSTTLYNVNKDKRKRAPASIFSGAKSRLPSRPCTLATWAPWPSCNTPPPAIPWPTTTTPSSTRCWPSRHPA